MERTAESEICGPAYYLRNSLSRKKKKERSEKRGNIVKTSTGSSIFSLRGNSGVRENMVCTSAYKLSYYTCVKYLLHFVFFKRSLDESGRRRDINNTYGRSQRKEYTISHCSQGFLNAIAWVTLWVFYFHVIALLQYLYFRSLLFLEFHFH